MVWSQPNDVMPALYRAFVYINDLKLWSTSPKVGENAKRVKPEDDTPEGKVTRLMKFIRAEVSVWHGMLWMGNRQALGAILISRDRRLNSRGPRFSCLVTLGDFNRNLTP